MLPPNVRDAAEARYVATRQSWMRGTLAEILAACATAFETWRYLHEQPSVHCSMGEMQRAFAVLSEGV